MKNIALIVAAADGIQSLQTGVGIVVNSFFEAFHEIHKEIGEPEIDLYGICPLVNVESSDFSIPSFDIVSKQCQKFGGKLITIQCLTSGKSLNEIWHGTDTNSPAEIWEEYCIALAVETEKMTTKYKKVFLIVHDTLFVNVSKYLNSPKVTTCWIPHSLGTLFHSPNKEERTNFEKDCIPYLIKRGDYIGYISQETNEHLVTNYGVMADSIISFYSGIYFKSTRYKSEELLDSFMDKYNIPKDKKIIFTWGRCADQKGIDIIIKSYKELLDNKPSIKDIFHLILLCPTETTYPEYMEKVNSLLEQLPISSFTFIAEFQDKIQYEILSYKNTKLILLNSRFETFGLTSIEAIFKAGEQSKIIFSPIPTFREVLGDFEFAVELEKNSEECLSNTILKNLDSPKNNLETITEQKNKIEKIFSLVKNHSFGLATLLSKT